MLVQFEVPPKHTLMDIAPRWQGKGDYIGEYGYVLAITSEGKLRCIMDDGGSEDIDPSQLTIISSR